MEYKNNEERVAVDSYIKSWCGRSRKEGRFRELASDERSHFEEKEKEKLSMTGERKNE